MDSMYHSKRLAQSCFSRKKEGRLCGEPSPRRKFCLQKPYSISYGLRRLRSFRALCFAYFLSLASCLAYCFWRQFSLFRRFLRCWGCLSISKCPSCIGRVKWRASNKAFRRSCPFFRAGRPADFWWAAFSGSASICRCGDICLWGSVFCSCWRRRLAFGSLSVARRFLKSLLKMKKRWKIKKVCFLPEIACQKGKKRISY